MDVVAVVGGAVVVDVVAVVGVAFVAVGCCAVVVDVVADIGGTVVVDVVAVDVLLVVMILVLLL